MTNNLLAASKEVAVFDLSEAAIAGVTANGASVAASVTDEKVTSASTIITMLPSSPHVQETVMVRRPSERSERVVRTKTRNEATTIIASSLHSSLVASLLACSLSVPLSLL